MTESQTIRLSPLAPPGAGRGGGGGAVWGRDDATRGGAGSAVVCKFDPETGQDVAGKPGAEAADPTRPGAGA